MRDNRITVLWLSRPGASSAATPGDHPLNRAQRRKWESVKRQLLKNTAHWPRFRCASGHVAAVDPEFADAFVTDPCAHCGKAIVRDVKEVN